MLWTKHLKQRIQKRLFLSQKMTICYVFQVRIHGLCLQPLVVSVPRFLSPKFISLHQPRMLEAMDLRIQSVRPANGGSVFGPENFKCWIPQNWESQTSFVLNLHSIIWMIKQRKVSHFQFWIQFLVFENSCRFHVGHIAISVATWGDSMMPPNPAGFKPAQTSEMTCFLMSKGGGSWKVIVHL